VTLRGQFDTFRAAIGVEAFSDPASRCLFEVRGDGKTLFRSKPLKPTDGPQVVRVSIRGIKNLQLVTRAEGEPRATTLGAWANAVVARRDAEVVVSPAQPVRPPTLNMYRKQATADRYNFAIPTKEPFCVVAKFWEDDLDPAEPPPSDRIGAPLTALATPGECEPACFVVYARQDLRDVQVKVSDLKTGKHVIPAENVDVRLVLRGLMRDIYVYPPEKSTVVSRFLWPYQSVDIPAGTLREYFLTVHVPDDAAAGLYEASVRIEPSGQPAVEVPLRLEVLPFRLRPLTRKAYGVYFRFPPDESQWPAIEGQLDDIRAHGGTMLKCPFGVRYEAGGTGIRASVERLRHALELLKAHGFHGPLPVSTGCELAARLLKYDPVKDFDDQAARAKFLAVIRDGMQKLQRLAKEFPEFELLPTHMDEVFGRNRLERYIRLTEAVRKASSLRVYITLHNTPRPGIREMMIRCDPFVDVRCYNGHAMDEWIRAGHSFEELARELKRSGDEAWVYYNIRGSFFKAEWTRLVNGFYLWISPLRVHVPWMYYSVHGNPVDDTDGPRLRGHDFVYAVPDPQQPDRLISTRHWEAFREGFDDMRYIGTLEDWIAERKGTTEAKAAQAWLDRLRARLCPDPEKLQQVEGESPILQTWAKQFDGPDYRRFRREAADWIIRLSGSAP
ncbi:MAG: hypothetical protein GXP27_14470, partial [Planctomycetes bacterium]|nr:hypothetical protein [Planctomycetota bacterium]